MNKIDWPKSEGGSERVLHPELAILLREDPHRDEKYDEKHLLFLLFIMNQYEK